MEPSRAHGQPDRVLDGYAVNARLSLCAPWAALAKRRVFWIDDWVSANPLGLGDGQ